MEPDRTRERTEDWIVPRRPPGGDGARVSLERTLAGLESRIDDAMSLARGSNEVWGVAEEGMQRAGEIAVLASEQAIAAAQAARDALVRATIAEAHAERSAAAAAAASMRADGIARRERQAPAQPRSRERRRRVRREAPPVRPTAPAAGEGAGDDLLRAFSERADGVLARLLRLERHPALGWADGPA